ncbi:hypothetical protein GCM10009801_55280 [Streptomyces albiaxialis]|uniref:Sortase n=1 Tax=Streptomyces albiaxialis TaxID=329523 RepID=A0ABN2WE42_9ACTN
MAPCCAPARRRVRHQAVPLALLAALALGAAPPLTPGEDRGVDGVTVTPETVTAGAKADISVDACEGDTGVAYSDAFEEDVDLKPDADGGLYGEPTIRASAEPGTHTVTVDCDGKQGVARGEFTVAGAQSPSPSPTPTPTATPTPTPSPASPSAPVRAGGGGTADGGAGGGFDAGGGLVLIGAALAAFVTYVLRTRRPNGDR